MVGQDRGDRLSYLAVVADELSLGHLHRPGMRPDTVSPSSATAIMRRDVLSELSALVVQSGIGFIGCKDNPIALY